MADLKLRSIRAELDDFDVEAAYALDGEILELNTLHIPPSMVDTRFLEMGAVLWLELAGRTEEARALVRSALDLLERMPNPDPSDQNVMQCFRDWLAQHLSE